MMKRVLKFAFCAATLVAGLCGCEKVVTEIDLGNLEGSWEKEYPKGVQQQETCAAAH